MKIKLVVVAVFLTMVLTACTLQTADGVQTTTQSSSTDAPTTTTTENANTTDEPSGTTSASPNSSDSTTTALPETDPPITTTTAPKPPETDPPITTTTAAKPPQTDPPVTTEGPATGDAPKASEIVGRIPASSAVDKSWFDDAAFIGDSVSLKLKTYCLGGALGKADFFTVGSYSTVNALRPVSDGYPHPSYQGVTMLSEDCVQKSGAKKVYIMLGMNDLSYGIEETIGRYQTLVENIQKKSPDAKIFIQSMTPMTTTSNIESAKRNNTTIKQYNQRLEEICEDNGWYFVDVASVMYDDSGSSLRTEYCSDPVDMGVHFTSEGCKKWVEYLLTHTVDFS